MTDRGLRDQLVDHARRMIAAGLVRGTSGNLSARTEEREAFLITPSGVDYETMRAEDIVLVALDGIIALQLGQASAVPDDEITRMHDFIHHHYGQV